MSKKNSREAKKQRRELKRKQKRLQLKKSDFKTQRSVFDDEDKHLLDFYTKDKNGNDFLLLTNICILSNKGKLNVTKKLIDFFFNSLNHHSLKSIKRAKTDGEAITMRHNCEYELSLVHSGYGQIATNGSGTGMVETEQSKYAITQLHKIKDLGLRFMLMTWHYQHESKSVDWKEYVSLSKQLSLEDRLYATYGLKDDTTNEERERDIKHITNTVKKKFFRKDNYIELYRSFRVNRGENIREAVKRESLQQKYGAGNSYSNRKVSTFLTGRFINKYMVDKYTRTENDDGEIVRLSNDEINSKLEFLIKNSSQTIFKDDARFNDSFGVIGKFRVKQSNIITVSDAWDTQEFIVDGSKTELLDYRFLNIIDYITQSYMLCLMKLIHLNLNRTVNLFSCFRNIDIVYDFLYWHIQKLCKTRKHLTSDAINDLESALQEIYASIFNVVDKENKVTDSEVSYTYLSTGKYIDLFIESKEKIFCSLMQNEDEELSNKISLDVLTGLRQTKKNWNQYTIDRLQKKKRELERS